MRISEVHIFGLRCSGTNYLLQLLRLNYPNLLVVEGDPCWKHMWQAESEFTLEKQPTLVNRSDILYLFIARDVFQWLSSFNLQPHHCPWAEGMSFTSLLHTSPFDSYSEERQVLEVYPSILEERRQKHHHITTQLVPYLNAELINYNILSKKPETIVEILNQFGIPLTTEFRNVTFYKSETETRFRPKTYEPISQENFDFIVKHVDWALEKQWGFERPSENCLS